ncbi:hypothetical protein BHE74_00027738 [Ensete ventricosum]|nr:hypothetical protein BHE74_00027738 [Ensete ventricosum]
MGLTGCRPCQAEVGEKEKGSERGLMASTVGCRGSWRRYGRGNDDKGDRGDGKRLRAATATMVAMAIRRRC